MFTKFLDPKNDVAFKKIFGDEKNSDILIHFLNDMLTFKNKKPIVSVSFLPTEQIPEIASFKTSIVDILCEDSEGARYIVEMQVARSKGFEKRAQYYAAKAYTSQAKQGGKYENLKEVIFLAIANYVMFPDKKAFKSDHIILDKVSLENDLQDFSFTFLELPKFTKKIDELENMVDRWAYFFKHAPEAGPEDLRKIIGDEKIIKRVFDVLDSYYWTEAQLRGYETVEKRRMDYAAEMDQKYYEGQAKGERNALLKVARAMLQQNMPLTTISSMTDLSEAEIRTLQASFKKGHKI